MTRITLDQSRTFVRETLAKGREMTHSIMTRTPDIDFLYFSNDMIGAGGLLYLLDKGVDIPGRIGLAGFNGVELLQGLPRRLATMDACRYQAGERAADIIALRHQGEGPEPGEAVELTPRIDWGDTLLRGAQPAD